MHIVTVPATTRFLRGQAGFLRSFGYTLLIVSSPGHELDTFSKSEGVESFRVTMRRAISPLRDIVALVRLTALIRRAKPDVVHAHTPKAGLLGSLAAWVAGVPVRIYHIRGLPYVTQRGAKRALLAATEWLSCTVATNVLSVSRTIMALAVRDRLVDAAKIRVLASGSGNGVDCSVRFNPANWIDQRIAVRDELGIQSNATVLGFVGRLVRDKGVHELHEAWKRVRVTHPSAVLVIIGPEERRNGADASVLTELRADGRVRIIGETHDIARYFAAFDLLVLPTYREGFPNVLLEAGAMGLPVVATLVPGCVDVVVEGETGVLVPPGSVDALETGIRQYLDSPELREQHGKQARAHVSERYAREVVWTALREYYDEITRD